MIVFQVGHSLARALEVSNNDVVYVGSECQVGLCLDLAGGLQTSSVSVPEKKIRVSVCAQNWLLTPCSCPDTRPASSRALQPPPPPQRGARQQATTSIEQ